MTPVMLLTDGFLANGAEPWEIPDVEQLPKIPVNFRTDPEGFHPFARDPESLVRSWAVPGTPGLEHRIGGLEKHHDSGNISYDPENHHRMTKVRAEKVARIADELPEARVEVGDDHGELLLVGWGSTYGAIHQAVRKARKKGHSVSQVHLRHLNPLPHGLGELLRRFDRVLVPEMNNGMLVKVLRSEFLVPAEGVDKIAGQPFRIDELEQAIDRALSDSNQNAAE
jgi:2-oxoglutarate ferredoxin oxidoreductase subunit alpha